MSIFSDFASAALTSARGIIGSSSLAIGGGTAVNCTTGTIGDSRDFEQGGYEAETELEAVVAQADFEAAYSAGVRTYLGKTAVVDGRTFRVVQLRFRAPVYVVELGAVERGA